MSSTVSLELPSGIQSHRNHSACCPTSAEICSLSKSLLLNDPSPSDISVDLFQLLLLFTSWGLSHFQLLILSCVFACCGMNDWDFFKGDIVDCVLFLNGQCTAVVERSEPLPGIALQKNDFLSFFVLLLLLSRVPVFPFNPFTAFRTKHDVCGKVQYAACMLL